jgi:hypothetical protein
MHEGRPLNEKVSQPTAIDQAKIVNFRFTSWEKLA